MRSRSLRLMVLAAAYLSIASPAYAYLDGATGSIILQALLGAVATGLVYWRLATARVKGFFGRLTKKRDDRPKSE